MFLEFIFVVVIFCICWCHIDHVLLITADFVKQAMTIFPSVFRCHTALLAIRNLCPGQHRVLLRSTVGIR